MTVTWTQAKQSCILQYLPQYPVIYLQVVTGMMRRWYSRLALATGRILLMVMGTAPVVASSAAQEGLAFDDANFGRLFWNFSLLLLSQPPKDLVVSRVQDGRAADRYQELGIVGKQLHITDLAHNDSIQRDSYSLFDDAGLLRPMALETESAFGSLFNDFTFLYNIGPNGLPSSDEPINLSLSGDPTVDTSEQPSPTPSVASSILPSAFGSLFRNFTSLYNIGPNGLLSSDESNNSSPSVGPTVVATEQPSPTPSGVPSSLQSAAPNVQPALYVISEQEEDPDFGRLFEGFGSLFLRVNQRQSLYGGKCGEIPDGCLLDTLAYNMYVG
jgi:hypothetical protein